MASLISARRAAEDFARLVDGSGTDVADRYADLTSTVDLLRRQAVPAARPEFVADLRASLMAAADTELVAAPDAARAPGATVVTLQPTRRRERRLAVAAAALVIVGGTAGVAAAAESALPGDVLYPVKRGIENAKVSLNSSDAAKGQDLIQQASTRLDEVDGLLSNGGSTSEISRTLSSFERSAAGGADLLFVAYQRDGDPEDLANLRGVFSDQKAQLEALAAQAPPTSQPDFASASALLSGLDQQARVLCGNCSPDNASGDATDLSSAAAFGGLITGPADAAADDALRAQAKALAEKAGQIAENTPKAPAGTSGSTTAPDGSSSVPVPSVPAQDGSGLTSTVTSVTGGVQGLIDQVGSATGITPVTETVTDAVTDTVDSVTGLLPGQ